jgi:hypothetical protein
MAKGFSKLSKDIKQVFYDEDIRPEEAIAGDHHEIGVGCLDDGFEISALFLPIGVDGPMDVGELEHLVIGVKDQIFRVEISGNFRIFHRAARTKKNKRQKR